MIFRKNKKLWNVFMRSLMKVFSIVLIWRGVWYIFDLIDIKLFGDSYIGTALASILLGLLLLYIIDEDLDEVS